MTLLGFVEDGEWVRSHQSIKACILFVSCIPPPLTSYTYYGLEVWLLGRLNRQTWEWESHGS